MSDGHDLISNFQARVLAGQSACLGLSICLVGIARNAESHLERMLTQVESLESRFRKVRYFVFENDSTDDTVRVLEEWRARKPGLFAFQSQVRNDVMPVEFGKYASNRFARMAAYRNEYVSWLRALSEKPDYVVVVDWNLAGGFDTNGLVAAFEDPQNWDVLCANGIDPLAFADMEWRRIKGHTGRDSTAPFCPWPSLDPNTATRVRVRSAFGGLAIYRAPLFDAFDYSPEPPVDCEHLMLHRKFPSKTRVFIDSQLYLVR